MNQFNDIMNNITYMYNINIIYPPMDSWNRNCGKTFWCSMKTLQLLSEGYYIFYLSNTISHLDYSKRRILEIIKIWNLTDRIQYSKEQKFIRFILNNNKMSFIKFT